VAAWRCLSLIDLEQFAKAIRQANYTYLAASAVVSVSWLAVRALVWHTLLRERAAMRMSSGR
jgi:uncharacterized membrane protein YbhN (UPF0104 family)